MTDTISNDHERLDGAGYPADLKDGQTLLGTRIIAIADVYQSMTSYRLYRTATRKTEALVELSQNKNRLYDAKIVDAALTVLWSCFRFAKV